MQMVPGDYRVQIINTTDGSVEKEISLPKLAHNAVFSQDGTELWVAPSDSVESTVLVYNTLSWQPNDTIIIGMYVSENLHGRWNQIRMQEQFLLSIQQAIQK